MNLEVIYEDNHIIAINKPSGYLVQGDKTGDKPLSEQVKAYLKQKYNKPGDVFLGVTHRLDRVTSGVLLFARTSKALERLNRMFKNKEIKKTYWAVVKELPLNIADTLVHYMIKDHKKNKSKAFTSEKKYTKRAELSYKLLGSIHNYHLLEVKPKTGRHHQIRVQLSKIGSPIKGDIKYGFARANEDKSIHLHARTINFLHPVKKEHISLTAKLPKDVVWNAFKQI